MNSALASHRRLRIWLVPAAWTLIWPALAFTLVSGCSGMTDSDHLTITVTPTQPLIGPGPDTSCSDFETYARALRNPTNTVAPVLTRSVTGPLISFSDFTLSWDSPETIAIQSIRVRVTAAEIQSGSVDLSLSPSEIEALLASFQGIIVPVAGIQPTSISSSDPTRYYPGFPATPAAGVSAPAVTAQFAPCGLRFGPIPLTNGNKTPPFTASVVIDVVGTSTDSSGNQHFVRKRVNSVAWYYGS